MYLIALAGVLVIFVGSVFVWWIIDDMSEPPWKKPTECPFCGGPVTPDPPRCLACKEKL